MTVTKYVSPEKIKAYTTVGGAPHLDGDYTVFGKVIKGLEVIDKIAATPTAAERPTNDIRMFVTVEEMSKSKITKLYGYVFPVEIKK
jgi:peptidyl-prolyl cis-trans isomerase B (cyclophilin B)